MECGKCQWWFHCKCIGKSKLSLRNVTYTCGYCDSPDDGSGEKEWSHQKFNFSGKEKKRPVEKRNTAAFTIARSKISKAKLVPVGLSNWEDLKNHIREYAKQQSVEEVAKYKKMSETIREGSPLN